MPNGDRDRKGHANPIDRARRFNDEPEEPWKPDVGDTVAGTVEGVELRETTYMGDTRRHPVIVLKQDDGTRRAVWCFHEVLRSELKKLKPQIGDRLAIKRLENAAAGYYRYKIWSDRDPPKFDWTSVGRGGDVAPENTQAAALGLDTPPSEEDFGAEALSGGSDLPF